MNSDLPSPSVTAAASPAEYGIAVFHHIGDVLCCTPIAKQLKIDNPDCRISWFTSQAGEVALRENPYIDEIIVLDGDQYALDAQIPQLKALRNWTRFFTPAAYMNYEAIPGGSLLQPKGSIFGIVKAAPRLNWTVPFTFPFRLSAPEQEQARDYWRRLPPGLKILVETDYHSEQSPWTDAFNFDMLDALGDLDPVFVFTAKAQPPFFESFRQHHPRSFWCNLPFRLNAELFNLCDAFIGVSSGLSCLSFSEYCRRDVPQIEVTRGEHWGAADLGHVSEILLCYSRERFQSALANLRERLLGKPAVPDFELRSSSVGGCPVCRELSCDRTVLPNALRCRSCGAVFRSDANLLPVSAATMDVLGQNQMSLTSTEFLQRSFTAECCREIFISSGLPRVRHLRQFVEKAAYVLAADGFLHLSAPNAEGLIAASGAVERYLSPADIFSFTPKFLRELLIQSGFFIECCVTECPAECREEVLGILRGARPDLSAPELDALLDEVNRRGAGEVIKIAARKRGMYKGRVLASPRLRRRESAPREETAVAEIAQR
jgi:hypothetical protein